MYNIEFQNALKAMNEQCETIKSFEYEQLPIDLNSDLLKQDIKYFNEQNLKLKEPFCLNFLKLYATRVLALSNASVASITLGCVYDGDKNIYSVANMDDFIKNDIGLQENQIAVKTNNVYAWITLNDSFIVDLANDFKNSNFIYGYANDLKLAYKPYIVCEFFERSVSAGVFEHIAKFPIESWFMFAKQQANAKNLI